MYDEYKTSISAPMGWYSSRNSSQRELTMILNTTVTIPFSNLENKELSQKLKNKYS